MTKLPSLLLLFALAGPGLAAEPLVDESSPLETLATDFGLADGPAWDGAGKLYFPDVKGGKLNIFWPGSKKVTVALEDAGRISATCFNHGRLYLSDNGNAQIAVLDGKTKSVLATFSDPKTMKPNDLVVDNAGGIYVTLTGASQVAYVRSSGEVTTAVEGIPTPNGITLSPDEKTLYVAAYKPKEIWAYDVTSPGQTANGRLLCKMDDGEALGADGMTIDRAGHVYCAGATDIWIWSPSGQLLHKIPCPTRPINCAFGNSDMQTLYITGFGGLYRQKMNISGRAPQPASTAAPPSKGDTRPSTDIPNGLQADLDVEYARYGDRRLLLDLFLPRSATGPSPCLVLVHGGGWMKGDKTKFRALAIELGEKGYVTAAIEYRLGGEAKFPAAIQDCNAAVRFLRANAAKYGIDPNRIGAVGGSAGGHLVGLMATAHDVPELQGDGGNPGVSSKLQAAIVMAGPMEILTGSVAEQSRKTPDKAYCNQFIGKGIDEAPELYRLADACVHISADDPPVMFLVGELDKPERNVPSREKFASVGVTTGVKVYKDAKHGCWNLLPWLTEMASDMDIWFREQMPFKK
ncbi:MAG: SMP-30/gluconolactonase/LRE family protein [Planctomycetaceae bacterium]